MVEKQVAKIEVEFKFNVGSIPSGNADAGFICVESGNGEKIIYQAEWLGNLWEVPCHSYGKELWPGEKVLGWAEEPKIKITYR